MANTLNLSAMHAQTSACRLRGKTLILMLFFFNVLTSVYAQDNCIYEGEIAHKEEAGRLHYYFSDLPYFECSEVAVVDSIKVKWYQLCNQWDDEFYEIAETGLYDTLTIPAEGWRAVWAKTVWYSPVFTSTGSISDISQTIYYAAPDAPHLEETISPNPNNGNFEIEYKTNALKQHTMIIGPYGIVYSRWHHGSCVVPIQLLAMNPSGNYQVITKWYFADDCTGMVVTRQGMVVVR
jgi:hypothetical protein